MTAQILVVDDEPDLEVLIQQKFRHQIRDGAVAFVFARDGVDALAVLKANGTIDMVVTDINMPRMDGLSLLQKLQEGEERISTIIVSAYGDMTNIRTAMNRGTFDFLTSRSIFPTWKRRSPRPSGTSKCCARRANGRRRQSGRMRRCRGYFSPNLAQLLASDTGAIDLRGRRRDIATVFTDIDSFTKLVESLEPDVLGPLLNDYLVGMTDVVFAHDGTVAKIVVENARAFRRARRAAGSCGRAVACVLAWTTDNVSERWRKKGLRSGLPASARMPDGDRGNFGGGRFFDYTAYGDTINVAAQLETANKQLGTRVASAPILRRKSRSFRGRPVAICCCAARPRRCGLRTASPDRVRRSGTRSYL